MVLTSSLVKLQQLGAGTKLLQVHQAGDDEGQETGGLHTRESRQAWCNWANLPVPEMSSSGVPSSMI